MHQPVPPLVRSAPGSVTEVWLPRSRRLLGAGTPRQSAFSVLPSPFFILDFLEQGAYRGSHRHCSAVPEYGSEFF